MLTFHVIPLFLVIASEAWNLKVCACAMILDSSLRSATFRMTECQHYLNKLFRGREISVSITLDYTTPRQPVDTPHPANPRTAATISSVANPTYLIKSSAERPDFGIRLTYICLTLKLPPCSNSASATSDPNPAP